MALIESLDRERRELLADLEELRHRRNSVSEEIAALKKKGEDASEIIAEMKKVSSQIKEKESAMSPIKEKLNELVMVIPNIPHESVAIGADEKDNPVIRTWGEIGRMDYESINVYGLGELNTLLFVNTGNDLHFGVFSPYIVSQIRPILLG